MNNLDAIRRREREDFIPVHPFERIGIDGLDETRLFLQLANDLGDHHPGILRPPFGKDAQGRHVGKAVQPVEQSVGIARGAAGVNAGGHELVAAQGVDGWLVEEIVPQEGVEVNVQGSKGATLET